MADPGPPDRQGSTLDKALSAVVQRIGANLNTHTAKEESEQPECDSSSPHMCEQVAGESESAGGFPICSLQRISRETYGLSDSVPCHRISSSYLLWGFGHV
eukprot:1573443-Rhodomonas_salina.4